ncbi:helix-turn-helix transcriptional regulator [Actinomadura flavalba]|uniref:helix-turn-helix transcriptional regulator n=1 Tax=Actinomadura flavalba TaxID=1120938 RepID=UPI00036B0FAE|nr:WYL domain-containing protein [Actinomadura flavalba]
MRDPSARLLRLLSLLQTPRDWPGAELADRLDVTVRTIRRDVDRLRELGYPVVAARGNVGGYRLTAGTAMPPLLLDDEETVAIAVALRTTAETDLPGVEDAALRALAKLQQVLPKRLAHRLGAVAEAAVPMPVEGGPATDPATLATLAGACQVGEKVRFAHTRADGTASRRLVEPHRLVAAARRWYLVAHDDARADWRMFRVDRITEVHRTGVRVPARALPGGVDAATFVHRSLGADAVRARVLLHAPPAEASVAARLGDLTPHDAATTLLTTRPGSPAYLAHRLTLLPMPYTVLDPPPVATALADLAARAAAASGQAEAPPSRTRSAPTVKPESSEAR